MNVRLRSSNIYHLFIIALIILGDISILFNIPIMRYIYAFIFTLFLPGFLFLSVFINVNKSAFTLIEIFIISILLSISIDIVLGLFSNSIIDDRPLSVYNLLLFYNMFLVLIIFYQIKTNTKLNSFFSKEVLKSPSKSLASVIMIVGVPIFLVIISVLGTYFMRVYKVNILLILLLALIIMYSIIIFLKDDLETHPSMVSIAIYLISLAILFFSDLISRYPVGRDVHIEFYVFKLVKNLGYWRPEILQDINFRYQYNASLSVSLLPTILSNIFGIDAIYVYKILYNILFALVPVILFYTYNKYLGNRIAFMLSILFMSQIGFIYISHSMVRMKIGLLFFVAFMWILLYPNLKNLTLLLLLSITMILIYYSISYITLIIIVCLVILIKVFKYQKKEKTINYESLAILYFSLIYLWYSMLTSTHFRNFVMFIYNSFVSIKLLLQGNAILHHETAKVLGLGNYVLPDFLFLLSHYIIFILIGIGFVSMTTRSLENQGLTFPFLYKMISTIAIFLFSLFVIIPHVSWGFGIDRGYLVLSSIILPLFFVGCKVVTRYLCISNKNCISLFVIIIVIFQFLSSTYLIHYAFGIPKAFPLEFKGIWYEEFYISSAEVSGVKWIDITEKNFEIAYDALTYYRILEGTYNITNTFFIGKICRKRLIDPVPVYLYLGRPNIATSKIYLSSYYDSVFLAEILSVNLTEWSMIYTNKEARIILINTKSLCNSIIKQLNANKVGD